MVQQKNYRDTLKFIELGKKWNCDNVVFARIYNWGTYEKKEFSDNISLFSEDGTGMIKPEFKAFFANSIFDDPIVKGIQIFRT